MNLPDVNNVCLQPGKFWPWAYLLNPLEETSCWYQQNWVPYQEVLEDASKSVSLKLPPRLAFVSFQETIQGLPSLPFY